MNEQKNNNLYFRLYVSSLSDDINLLRLIFCKYTINCLSSRQLDFSFL